MPVSDDEVLFPDVAGVEEAHELEQTACSGLQSFDSGPRRS